MQMTSAELACCADAPRCDAPPAPPAMRSFALSLLQDVTRLTANGAAMEETLSNFQSMVEGYAPLWAQRDGGAAA